MCSSLAGCIRKLSTPWVFSLLAPVRRVCLEEKEGLWVFGVLLPSRPPLSIACFYACSLPGQNVDILLGVDDFKTNCTKPGLVNVVYFVVVRGN